VSRSVQVLATAIVFAMLVTAAFGETASPHQVQPPSESLLMGRLATVEPRARRISVVADDSADRLELLVAEDGEILRESEELTLSDLVIQVGSRVTVRYRLEGGVRIASRITVEPPPAG
jgi:hypothetical protein